MRQDGYSCTSTCESVWFKMWNSTASIFGEYCKDPAYQGQYANIM